MKNWLSQVFSEGIGFDLERIQGPGVLYPEPLRGLLEKCIQTCYDQQGPCVLPVTTDAVTIFLSAKFPEEVAELHSIAQAHLGTVYALIDPEIVTKASSTIQKTLLEHMPGGLVTIHIPRKLTSSSNYQRHVYATLSLVLEFVDRYKNRPPLMSNVRRPIGRILRDFFIALRDYDEPSSWQYFEEIQRSESLSPRNQLLLEIQAYGAFGKWNEIVRHARLSDALSGRVPRLVAVSFLLAADALFLHQASLSDLNVEAARNGLSLAVSFFSRKPDLGSDSESRKGLRIWAVGAVLFGNMRGAESVKSIVGEEWFRKLTEIFSVPRATNSDLDSVDDRLATLLKSHATLDNAIALLKLVPESDDSQCGVIADTLQKYPDVILDEIRAKQGSRSSLDGLMKFYEVPEVNGWKQWIVDVSKNQDPGSLIELLNSGLNSWDRSEWDETELNLALNSDSNSVKQILRDMLPILLDWLERNEIQISPNTIDLLLINLALDDISSIKDLSLARDLLELTISQPHTAENYGSMLDAVGEIWGKVGSVFAVSALFDIFDLLLDAPCSSESSRLNLWNNLQEFLLSQWRRLDDETKAMAKSISEELQGSSLQFELGSEQEDSAGTLEKPDLRGKKVGIYSLIEGAALRAKKVMEALYPGISVVANHDETATPALRNLAQTADYFVFASRAAKHQAFYPITKIRSDIIYPSGKGTVSILRAFSDAIH